MGAPLLYFKKLSSLDVNNQIEEIPAAEMQKFAYDLFEVCAFDSILKYLKDMNFMFSWQNNTSQVS